MAFSESFLTELVERNDIVDVVSGYVRLSKKSGSNMFGLCPFHSEKTPSFSVSPDKQIYHCFGCGKGGGVINFIMEIENLGFRDAVEFLARRAGMQMPEEENDKESQKRARMLALNKDAAHFFYEQLYSPAGRPGLEYMQGRRIGRAAANILFAAVKCLENGVDYIDVGNNVFHCVCLLRYFKFVCGFFPVHGY